ncbi:MAG: BatA and WFA domain-containing protein [Planctomycetota bacterium]
MTFLAPMAGLLAAGLTLPVLGVLYVLKLRRQPAVVPATLLWAQAVSDLEANTPFQRFRSRWLFWLQLLALGLLLLAVARPALEGEPAPEGLAVIVLDRSASMNTVDPGFDETRLERAKARALAMVDGLAEGAGDGVAVVTFAETAVFRTDFTRDAGRLRSAIEEASPTDQRSGFDRVAGLLAGRAEGGGPAITAVVLSDGAFDPPASRPGMGRVDWRYARIGPEGEGVGDGNVGITGLSARRSIEEPGRVEVLVTLANTSAGAARARLSLSVAGVAGALATRGVDVPGVSEDGVGRAEVLLSLSLPRSVVLRASVSPGGDLVSDDTAWLVLPERRRLRVLLAGSGLAYARAAAEAVPGVTAEATTAEQLAAMGPADFERNVEAGTGFDAVILAPGEWGGVPGVPTLSFGASWPMEALRLVGPGESPRASPVLDWDRRHPSLANLELGDLTLFAPGRWVAPASAQVLAVGLDGPVIVAVDDGGVRRIAASFGVGRADTDWPLFVSFPAFVDNALRWLTLDPGAAGRWVRAGATGRVELSPGEEGAVVSWEGPERLESPPAADVRGGGLFGPADRAGLYRAEPSEAVLAADRVQAVNLCDAGESDNRARAELRIEAPSTAGGAGATAGSLGTDRRELWPWLVAGAVLVLCAEWGFYGWRSRV